MRVAWWLKHYLAALAFFCAFFGRNPDEEKLDRMIRRSLRVDIE